MQQQHKKPVGNVAAVIRRQRARDEAAAQALRELQVRDKAAEQAILEQRARDDAAGAAIRQQQFGNSRPETMQQQ